MKDLSRRRLFMLFGGCVGAAVSSTPAVPAALSAVQVPFDRGQFNHIREALIGEIGADRFDWWFKSIEFESMREGVVTASVSVSFLKRWIEHRYSSVLLRALQQADPSVEQVMIYYRKGKARAQPAYARA